MDFERSPHDDKETAFSHVLCRLWVNRKRKEGREVRVRKKEEEKGKWRKGKKEKGEGKVEMEKGGGSKWRDEEGGEMGGKVRIPTIYNKQDTNLVLIYTIKNKLLSPS